VGGGGGDSKGLLWELVLRLSYTRGRWKRTIVKVSDVRLEWIKVDGRGAQRC
jgi:hypothetical protein